MYKILYHPESLGHNSPCIQDSVLNTQTDKKSPVKKMPLKYILFFNKKKMVKTSTYSDEMLNEKSDFFRLSVFS